MTDVTQMQGLMLGLALGDALGLPTEGLSPQRIARRYPDNQPWRHGFIGRYGMGSDDTEHAWFVAQSLLAQPQDADAFARRLAWCLRGWFLGLPAGIGLATGRAILKLCLGFSPKHSGVYSAGNGPAMRVAPIGAFFADDAAQRHAYVRASTQLTHTDPKAYRGAWAIAELIAAQCREDWVQRPELVQILSVLNAPEDEAWQTLLDTLANAIHTDISVADFALQLGLDKGVTGYMYHSVPVAIYAWYRHFGDYPATVEAVFRCGGDTDTVGAIVGALAGCSTGIQGIPQDWQAGFIEYPRSRRHLLALAQRLGQNQTQPVRYFWLALIPRNILFFIVVLLHGFGRLVP